MLRPGQRVICRLPLVPGSVEYLPNHRQEVLDHHRRGVPRYFRAGLWEQTQLQQRPVHHLFVLPQANEVWPNSAIHPLNVHGLRLLLHLVSQTQTSVSKSSWQLVQRLATGLDRN